MADHSDASIRELVRGAMDDARELFREELALAKAEVRLELGKVSAAATRFTAGGVALWFAAMFLLVTVALGIAALLGWPAWAGFGIVAVLLGVIGVGLLLAGRSAVRRIRPLPRTVESVKENLT
jgi:hypothetical protein